MLPITPFLPDISDCLAHNNNVVVQAEPGAGKSTALPLSLMNAPWLNGNKIVMLEPRRVAAKTIAHYLARQLSEKVGERVGYQIKNERKLSSQTRLEIVTEGILTQRLQNDPELTGIGLIIFDEFHERAIQADLSLMLTLEVQETLREDLKLLVMSATIDTEQLSGYLGNASVIQCPGRSYPVTVEYREANSRDSRHQPSGQNTSRAISQKVITALHSVFSDASNKGDTLVFLPGQAAIKQCLSDARQTFQTSENFLFLPLYGGLSIDQQEQALQPDPSGKRRVIFSTNIAETSLTIDGITTVIDSGLEKIAVYDPTSGLTGLETSYISKASAEQRKGRAGRLQAGHCIRLWSTSKQTALKDFQAEEILTADLSSVVLDLLAWGTADIQQAHWLTPPPAPAIESAKNLLQSLNLISPSGQTNVPLHINTQGRKATTLGLHPRLAAMLLCASTSLEKNMACELAALLSEKGLFYQRQGVDILDRLMALQDYKTNRKQALSSWPMKAAIAEQILNTTKSLKRRIKQASDRQIFSLSELQTTAGKLLLMAYPDRLAKRRTANDGNYLLANGKGATLFDDDPLFNTDWLVVSDCNAQSKNGQIFSAAPITFEEIQACLGGHIIEENRYQLDDKKQITGRKITQYQSITLSTTPLSKIPEEAFQQCLHQLLKSEGLKVLNWTGKCEAWLARAQWLGENMNAFPSLSESILINTLDEWLLPYLPSVRSMADLKRVNMYELMKGILSWEDQQILKREAPQAYITPSNRSVPIKYDKHQAPTVSVQLQDMFGEVASPKIAQQRVALRFELLSPARRPIQTTSDLANFWQTSYFDVAKEMRGQYPKHRWPDKPLLEKAGRSIKSRS